ncbi:MAG TPA: hypothetical protein VF079_09030 [Sphingomicrobium sp.]
MRIIGISFVAVAAVMLAAAPAAAGNWSNVGAGNGHGERVTLLLDESGHSYIFECAPDALIVTQTGVTELVDVRTKTKVGDAPGSAMSPGASVMALFTGDGDPEFQPATAVANPAKGWDLSLRFTKSDKRLKGLGKAEIISLFTTGTTDAVPLDAADRKLFGDFVKRCR